MLCVCLCLCVQKDGHLVWRLHCWRAECCSALLESEYSGALLSTNSHFSHVITCFVCNHMYCSSREGINHMFVALNVHPAVLHQRAVWEDGDSCEHAEHDHQHYTPWVIPTSTLKGENCYTRKVTVYAHPLQWLVLGSKKVKYHIFRRLKIKSQVKSCKHTQNHVNHMCSVQKTQHVKHAWQRENHVVFHMWRWPRQWF